MRRKEKHTFYNYQFKHTAVKITDHPAILSVDVVEALGIHPIMLYRWRQERRNGKIEDNDAEARSRTALLEAKATIRALERQLQQLRDENVILKKAERRFPKKISAFRFIAEHPDLCSVSALYRKLGVSRGGYYAWRGRQDSQRRREDRQLLEEILEIFGASRHTYGYPRIHAVLKAQGILCGRHRVARIMRENDLKAKMARRFKFHRHRHAFFEGIPNLLLDQPHASVPNQVWVGDVSYIRVRGKWSYASTIANACIPV